KASGVAAACVPGASRSSCIRGILMHGSTSELRVHFVEQRDLSLVDLAPSYREIELGGAVKLRKLPDLARAGWPLLLGQVALNHRGIRFGHRERGLRIRRNPRFVFIKPRFE